MQPALQQLTGAKVPRCGPGPGLPELACDGMIFAELTPKTASEHCHRQTETAQPLAEIVQDIGLGSQKFSG